MDYCEQFRLIPTDSIPPRCVSCRYWVEHDFPYWDNGQLVYEGECHRHAPRLTLADIEPEKTVRNAATNQNIMMAGVFPDMHWYDFCGDHVAATGDECESVITVKQPVSSSTPQ